MILWIIILQVATQRAIEAHPHTGSACKSMRRTIMQPVCHGDCALLLDFYPARRSAPWLEPQTILDICPKWFVNGDTQNKILLITHGANPAKSSHPVNTRDTGP